MTVWVAIVQSSRDWIQLSEAKSLTQADNQADNLKKADYNLLRLKQVAAE